MLGGPIIAGATLTRFFALHVFVIPGALIGLLCIHLLMVIKLGINEWPMPGRLVRRKTYSRSTTRSSTRTACPSCRWPSRATSSSAAAIVLAVMACAAYFGPFGPKGFPDPTIVDTLPRPDYFFLWLFAVASLLPPHLETPALLVGPVIGIGLLLALPFIAGEGEKSWRRRPMAVLTIVLVAVSLGTLTRLGTTAPWSPVMNAWSSAPVPAAQLQGRSALERQGALVLQAKQCRNCHELGDEGGRRGPALDDVAVRLTRDQLIRQVLQGGGNMPAYGNSLSPAETTALVAFLESLAPKGQAPARDSAEPARPVADGASPAISMSR